MSRASTPSSPRCGARSVSRLGPQCWSEWPPSGLTRRAAKHGSSLSQAKWMCFAANKCVCSLSAAFSLFHFPSLHGRRAPRCDVLVAEMCLFIGYRNGLSTNPRQLMHINITSGAPGVYPALFFVVLMLYFNDLYCLASVPSLGLCPRLAYCTLALQTMASSSRLAKEYLQSSSIPLPDCFHIFLLDFQDRAQRPQSTVRHLHLRSRQK